MNHLPQAIDQDGTCSLFVLFYNQFTSKSQIKSREDHSTIRFE